MYNNNMNYLIILSILLLTACSDDCKDRTRSDLDYCNCYPKNCQPSEYKPK